MEPESVDAVLDRANNLLEAGKPAESLRVLDQIEDSVVDADDRIEWATLRAWALSALDCVDEALDTLDALLDEFPTSARLHGTRGVVLSNAEELDEARAALELAVSLDEKDEVALANLALVYEKLHDFEKAVETYDRAIILGADIDWALQRRAAAQSEAGDYAGAKATLKRYLSLVPDDVEQWIALAILHSDDDEYDRAFACYRTAERLDANSPWLHLNWGVTAVRAGALKLARRELRRLRDADPHAARVHLLRAFILEEEGRLTAAQVAYEQALAHAPADDDSELAYTFEMAMEFFTNRKMREHYERVLRQAYVANVCTVELCEAYREAAGAHADQAVWFSLMLEGDYRAGLSEVHERSYDPPIWPDDDEPAARRAAQRERPLTRFLRNYQVIARDRDEAVALTLAFAQRMAETGVRLREFVGEEPVEDAHLGVYEVEHDSLVFGDDSADD